MSSPSSPPTDTNYNSTAPQYAANNQPVTLTTIVGAHPVQRQGDGGLYDLTSSVYVRPDQVTGFAISTLNQ